MEFIKQNAIPHDLQKNGEKDLQVKTGCNLQQEKGEEEKESVEDEVEKEETFSVLISYFL